MIRTAIHLPQSMSRVQAARIVQLAGHYQSRMMIEHDQTIVNVKSMLGLLSLCSEVVTGLTLIVEGEDEAEANEAMLTLLPKEG